jgi:hypothetical protein
MRYIQVRKALSARAAEAGDDPDEDFLRRVFRVLRMP